MTLFLRLISDYPIIAVCPGDETQNVSRFDLVFRSITTSYKLKNGTRRNATNSYRQLAILTLSDVLIKCQAFAITTRNMFLQRQIIV